MKTKTEKTPLRGKNIKKHCGIWLRLSVMTLRHGRYRKVHFWKQVSKMISSDSFLLREPWLSQLRHIRVHTTGSAQEDMCFSVERSETVFFPQMMSLVAQQRVVMSGFVRELALRHRTMAATRKLVELKISTEVFFMFLLTTNSDIKQQLYENISNGSLGLHR